MATQILENVTDRTSGPVTTLDPNQFMSDTLSRMPYRAVLCLRPLVERWRERLATTSDAATRLLGERIVTYADAHPDLLCSGIDPVVLRDHDAFMSLLMAACFPIERRSTQMGKASAPFSMDYLYETPRLRELKEDSNMCYTFNKSPELFFATTLVEVCSVILNKFYGQDIEVEPQAIVSLRPKSGGVERHFKTDQVLRFFDIELLKPLPELTQEQINELLSNIYNHDLWTRYLPPDHFLIHGLMAVNMIEVTAEETLSRLKYQLLERDAVVHREHIRRQEHILESYFNHEGLRLGLTAIDYPTENRVNHEYRIRHDFLADQFPDLLDPALGNNVYLRTCRYNEVLLVEDLERLRPHTPIERALLRAGIRSILVTPLHNKEGEIIGLLEVGSPEPFGMNSFMELKLRDVANLFSVALERSRLEVDNQIESIIRMQFTAVHPSVEWKFVETAYDILTQQGSDDPNASMVPPIRFDNVYPLYAQADIVGSSTLRNEAIQHDFLTNLELAEQLIREALQRVDLPILHHYQRRVERICNQLRQEGISSADESQIMLFLKDQLHPFLRELRRHDREVLRYVDDYFARMDPDFEIVYDQRKKYERSVSLLNDDIAHFLDLEEQRTQEMMPHYFEKYKTDGVEYNIYLGDSLLKNGGFSPTYLRNLRLWQLISTAEITRRVERIQERLPMPLQTAQLIFVYASPLSIIFRRDEKRFDVDGSYNVRYEIIKKRIDKAYVADTEERLTQAGKIAVVYTDDAVREEYLDYFRYLADEGFVEPDIEQLEVSALQGVNGLRALRATVRYA